MTRAALRQALLLSAKDTRLFFRDRFGFGFAMIFPLLFVFAFSLALGGIGPGDEQLRLALATEEERGLSRGFIDDLTAESAGPAEWTAVEWAPEEARRAVEDGELSGFLLFPADFTDGILGGTGARIEVVASGDDAAHEAALRGLARGIAGRITTLALAGRAALLIEGPTAPDPDALGAVAERPPLASFTIEQVGGIEPFNAANFTLPGYLTMFVFFTAALGAESIARERQTQTLERLLSNGVRRSSIVFGKLLGGIYRGIMQLAVLWTVGLFAFAIDLGASPAAVIAVSVLLAFASAAFGVMLAAMVVSVRSASSVAVFTSLTFAPLGGSWWPLFIAPDWQRALGRLTPHGWANDAFNKLMLFGAEAGDVALDMTALAVFAAVFIGVALLRFRLAPSN